MHRVIATLLVFLWLSLGTSAAQEVTGTPHPKVDPLADKSGPEKIWATLMQGNKRFMAGKVRAHDVQRERKLLLKGQHPNVVVLTCSDSRVPPELIFDEGLGDLFVVRSAGNVADAIGLGSIEY